MSHRTTTFVSVLFAAALASPALAQRGSRDSDDDDRLLNVADILLHNGRSHDEVMIGSYDFKEIKYREKGRRPESVKGEEISEIRFRHAPAAYTTGLSQVRAGLYDRAVSSFTAARSSAKDDSWVKVFATYWLGETHRLMGSQEALDTAIEEFGRVVNTAGGHFVAPAAIYGLGLAQASAGRGGEAISTFGKLAGGEFGDLWRLQAKVGEGNAYLDQKDAGKARQAFEIANQTAMRYPSVRREAQVGIGKAYIMDKRYDDAVRFFDEIIGQPGVQNEVAGGAWLGKGDCRYEEARAGGGNQKALKEALIAYQTCVVRYAGVPEVYPKALYMSATIYKALNLNELAGHMEQELKSRCPSSQWADRLSRD